MGPSGAHADAISRAAAKQPGFATCPPLCAPGRHPEHNEDKIPFDKIFLSLIFLFCSVPAERPMDLPQSFESDKTALARILAGLFALLGLTAGSVPGRIPRELHRDILRVLRPAESAARRLIVIVARTIKVKTAPPRPAPAGLVRAGHGKPRLSFQLFDPRKRFFREPPRPKDDPRPRPRIAFFGGGEARRISLGREPPPPKDDKADGLANPASLARRLAALKGALDDLPRQAARLARALARRRKSPRLKFQSPLRPGPAPGSRKRPLREIDHVLDRCHWLAREALASDTS